MEKTAINYFELEDETIVVKSIENVLTIPDIITNFGKNVKSKYLRGGPEIPIFFRNVDQESVYLAGLNNKGQKRAYSIRPGSFFGKGEFVNVVMMFQRAGERLKSLAKSMEPDCHTVKTYII